MYEVISVLPPYQDIGHDNIMAIKTCNGLRPRFNIKCITINCELSRDV
jgi:hypothetical protein